MRYLIYILTTEFTVLLKHISLETNVTSMYQKPVIVSETTYKVTSADSIRYCVQKPPRWKEDIQIKLSELGVCLEGVLSVVCLCACIQGLGNYIPLFSTGDVCSTFLVLLFA